MRTPLLVFARGQAALSHSFVNRCLPFVGFATFPLSIDLNTYEVQKQLSNNIVRCSFCSYCRFKLAIRLMRPSVKMSLTPKA